MPEDDPGTLASSPFEFELTIRCHAARQNHPDQAIHLRRAQDNRRVGRHDERTSTSHGRARRGLPRAARVRGREGGDAPGHLELDLAGRIGRLAEFKAAKRKARQRAGRFERSVSGSRG